MTNPYENPERQREQHQQPQQQPPGQTPHQSSQQPQQQSQQPPQQAQQPPQQVTNPGQQPFGQPQQSSHQPPQQPTQGSSQQPSQQGMAQQPSQRGMAQQPSQRGMAQQPSQRGMAQQPSQQGMAQQPSQQGMAQQPSQQPMGQSGQQISGQSQGMSQQQTQPQQIPGHQTQSAQSMSGARIPVGGPGTQSMQQMPEQQLQSVSIEEVIQSDVVTAEQDETVSEVVEKMSSEDVGSVVVIDDEQQPIGVITDRKIALTVEELSDLGEREVSELLSGNMITGSTDMTVSDALNELNENTIRRLPIVADDGKLEGIVTLDDLLVLLASEFETAAGVIKNQSSRM